MKVRKRPEVRTAADGWAAVVSELEIMCKSLARRYHQDPADVWGDVGLAVMQAHDKYDPARNDNYGRYMRWKVWEHLKTAAKGRYRKRRKEVQPDPEAGLEATESCYVPWPIDEWADGLEADARTVVLLSVGQPPGVRAVLSRAGGDSPANVRRAVRIELKRAAGWPDDRIRAAFSEVRAAVEQLYTSHFKPANAGTED